MPSATSSAVIDANGIFSRAGPRKSSSSVSNSAVPLWAAPPSRRMHFASSPIGLPSHWCHVVPELFAERLQERVLCRVMTEDVARHEPEDGVVDDAVFRDR